MPAAVEMMSAGICETRPSPTVSDRVGLERVHQRHALLDDADDEAADDVDRGDEEAGDRVAADELGRRRPSRRRSRPRARSPRAAPRASLLVDEARVEVGVDRHLLAGHRVEGEARRHLGDAPGALGDDDELDDDQDQEEDDADDEVAADDELAEGLDHAARRARALAAVQQDEARRGDVERQPESVTTRSSDGKTENSSGRSMYIATSEDQQRQREVDREQEVEQDGGSGDHQHGEDADHAGGEDEVGARRARRAMRLPPSLQARRRRRGPRRPRGRGRAGPLGRSAHAGRARGRAAGSRRRARRARSRPRRCASASSRSPLATTRGRAHLPAS